MILYNATQDPLPDAGPGLNTPSASQMKAAGFLWNPESLYWYKPSLPPVLHLPAGLEFTNQTGVATGGTVTSNTLTLSSPMDSGLLSVATVVNNQPNTDGGSFSINAGAFVTSATVYAGDTVALKTPTLSKAGSSYLLHLTLTLGTTNQALIGEFTVTTTGTLTPGITVTPTPDMFMYWGITGYIDVETITTADVTTTLAQVTYRLGGAATTATETLSAASLLLDLTPLYDETIVAGSVRFTFGDRTYVDRLGQLYYAIDPLTGSGTYGGTIDYASGLCNITAWNPGASPVIAIQSLLTTMNFNPVSAITLRTPASPIKVGVFQIRATPVGGGVLTATANNTGEIISDYIQGFIEYATGVVHLAFGQWVLAAGNEDQYWYVAGNVVGTRIFKPRYVYADTVLYTTVAYTYLPLSAAILGLDPVKLPSDGRIPIYSPGDVVVVLNDQTTVGTFTSSGTTDLGRVRLAKLTIRDSANNPLDITKYSANLDTGIITWGSLTGVSQPLTIVDRIEDMAVLSDVQINGQLTLSKALTHAYPANTTLVSNAVVYGTIYAHTSVPYDQQTWTNVWSDALIGSGVAAQYNNTQYPIIVDNASAIQERWLILFTSSTLFNVVGEHVGQIITGGSTSTATAPNNPNTSTPYFSLPAAGWGSGWATGNVLRFNTYSANVPIWVIQAIGQGAATSTDYTFCLEFRGDIDTP